MAVRRQVCRTLLQQVAQQVVRLLAVAPLVAAVLALAVASAFLIWLRHHENIARILKGTEPRIGAKAR